MWESFFGFKKTPFSDSPDAKQLFASQTWNQVKTRLEFLAQHHGVGLITGEVGAGKSTAARVFTGALNNSLYKILYVHFSTGSALDLLRNGNMLAVMSSFFSRSNISQNYNVGALTSIIGSRSTTPASGSSPNPGTLPAPSNTPTFFVGLWKVQPSSPHKYSPTELLNPTTMATHVEQLALDPYKHQRLLGTEL